MDLTTETAIENLCWGLAFLGTGGGGRIEVGLDMLLPALRAGRRLLVVPPDALDDADCTCWAIIVGGRDPDEPPDPRELKRYGLCDEVHPHIVPRLVAAVRELSNRTERTPRALVSLELSSAATAATILAATELGIPTLDGDYVGRAIPELVLTTLELARIGPCPVVMVDRWGNVVHVTEATGAAMVDRIGRMISRAAFGRGIATVGHLLPMRATRQALIAGSLTRAARIGAALRAGEAQRDDKLGPLRRETAGRVLFSGIVERVDWRSTEPFAFRELDYMIRGTGASGGSMLSIWIKNEHHVATRDGSVLVTSPDIITVLDPATNRPLMTIGDVVPGREVLVFGMSAIDGRWHTPEGERLLGPRHFGLGFDAVPFS